MLTTWVFALAISVTVSIVLLLLHNPKVSALFHQHVRDRPKRRLLLATIGFFSTFALARAAAYAAYRKFGPFHYIYIHGTHIHHLVWGILLLLIVGFCWLVEVGDGAESSSLFAGRLMSLLYGVGAALTLDELAIWLNLEEGIYWTHRDRASLDAIILFGAALLIALLGRTFAKALSAELYHSSKRHTRQT